MTARDVIANEDNIKVWVKTHQMLVGYPWMNLCVIYMIVEPYLALILIDLIRNWLLVENPA